MLARLPVDLLASVHVVLHISATGGRTLPRILDRAGPLLAGAAVDGENVRRGRIYVAPPDRHLLISEGATRLSRGPRQNGLRPAADPLFRSAALYGGARVIAVVLSGTLDDAAVGSATVEHHGGIVLVQDPRQASYDGMPRSALATTSHAVVAEAFELAGLITRLVTTPVEDVRVEPAAELRAEVAGLLAGAPHTDSATHQYSGLSCPDCGGPLYHADESSTSSYDCQVGHRWAPQALLEEQGAAVERALWLAIRSLEDRAKLTEWMADAAHRRGHAVSAARFAEAAKEAAASAEAVRSVVNDM
jgi:two-component system, chemotaxis family, protein-glutamate methylesterase/glutaminase